MEDVPKPEGELIVAVRAAGVSFPDLLMTRGEYQMRQPLPFTLGWEAAGDVVSAAERGCRSRRAIASWRSAWARMPSKSRRCRRRPSRCPRR